MTEIWKPVVGYEGLYEVSNMGRVKSITHRKCVHGIDTISPANKIMSPTDNGHGYKIVSLSINKKRKNHYVHRIVAECFVPNPKEKKYINHIDYDTSNNRADNLEWCTQKENIHHSITHMSKRKTKATSNTGELYISKQTKDGKYRVTVDRKQIGVYDTLDIAKSIREEVLNEIDITERKRVLCV